MCTRGRAPLFPFAHLSPQKAVVASGRRCLCRERLPALPSSHPLLPPFCCAAPDSSSPAAARAVAAEDDQGEEGECGDELGGDAAEATEDGDGVSWEFAK